MAFKAGGTNKYLEVPSRFTPYRGQNPWRNFGFEIVAHGRIAMEMQ